MVDPAGTLAVAAHIPAEGILAVGDSLAVEGTLAEEGSLAVVAGILHGLTGHNKERRYSTYRRHEHICVKTLP